MVVSENRAGQIAEDSMAVTDLRVYDLADGLLVAGEGDSGNLYTYNGLSAWQRAE
jgi:hypothetical protein